jgi:hypothetical protein
MSKRYGGGLKNMFLLKKPVKDYFPLTPLNSYGFSSPIFASEWRYGRFYLCPTTQATTASTERDCKPIMEV